jgi:hypothetical protein
MKHIVEKPAASDAEDEASDAEAKAAMFIKAKCEAGELFAARLSDPAEDYAVQFAYYERIRDACIACVDKLNDEFYRGFAIHQIIKMCVAANDMAVGRALLLAVQDDFLREKISRAPPH